MEPLTIAKAINNRIQELERLRAILEPLAQKKASASADYEKTLAITIVGLKNGKEFGLGDAIIKESSVTLVEKVARGICWQEKLAMDSAESAYKNTLKIIELTESQLNGYQSIFRYLEAL